MCPILILARSRLMVAVALALTAVSALAATAQRMPNAQSVAAGPSPLLPLTADEVLTHVRRSVGWYHDLAALEQSSLQGVGALARGELQQQALTAVGKAFEFAYAAEDVLGREARQSAGGAGGGKAAAQASAPTLPARLAQESANLSAQEASLRAEMAAVEARLRRTRGANARAALAEQRARMVAALQLVQQIESNVEQLRRFQESAIAGPGKTPKGLRAQLKALESSIPELSAAEAGPAAVGGHAPSTPAPKSTPTNFQPQSAGIVPLIGQWYALHGNRVQIQGAIDATTNLEAQLTATRSRLLATVHRLIGSGMASIAAGGTTPPAMQRRTIEAATAQLRQLSSVILPLAEQALMLSNAQTSLEDWRNTLAAQESSVARYLAIRVGILLAWVAAVLVIAEIWRRVTFRYLADVRRRRPFLMLRRVVLGIALILVIVFNLVSQVGSIATYAGLLTAGLAVALQNVILAVVAYFFLIGRYGVRVGDRVTISGVTGRVVDVSLLRIYLMELSGPDLHSTGRMVVLSNAVLFQPTALFKQIPGAEYLWHSVTLTILATADVERAYGSLESAASRVYETYRPAIQRQHDLAQRFIEFETAAPAPEVRLRLTDNGLECSVRYPVVAEKAAHIDQQMLDALRKAVEGDEQLKLVASGGLALKSSEG